VLKKAKITTSEKKKDSGFVGGSSGRLLHSEKGRRRREFGSWKMVSAPKDRYDSIQRRFDIQG
jgi:hypothetical protein